MISWTQPKQTIAYEFYWLSNLVISTHTPRKPWKFRLWNEEKREKSRDIEKTRGKFTGCLGISCSLLLLRKAKVGHNSARFIAKPRRHTQHSESSIQNALPFFTPYSFLDAPMITKQLFWEEEEEANRGCRKVDVISAPSSLSLVGHHHTSYFILGMLSNLQPTCTDLLTACFFSVQEGLAFLYERTWCVLTSGIGYFLQGETR